ncbi:7229_t:CDS:2 [Gigaspora rosea]|nr:7229_t:CDS:2 [Gigaspora rosea]
MVKYTKERLLKHQMVVQVSDCESHIKNGCKLQEDSAIHKAYISRVFTHTTHEELQLLDKELIRQSKWRIEEVQDSQVFKLCFENIVQVKRLVDTIKYAGPIIAMSDNTKLKERLGFSSLYGCIVETAANIFELHKKLLDIAAHLKLPIPGFGADGTSAEFNAQNQLCK